MRRADLVVDHTLTDDDLDWLNQQLAPIGCSARRRALGEVDTSPLASGCALSMVNYATMATMASTSPPTVAELRAPSW